MKLCCKETNVEYEFDAVRLVFETGTYSEKFGEKNNKTVLETLQHRRYAKLRDETEKNYPANVLDEPLGSFLLRLKQSGDDFYRRFLNRDGDEEYSIFRTADKGVIDKRGIYAYKIKNELKYIGRCRDSMQKRVNQGYGKIHPKNCYIDGQATNCRLNALITAERKSVSLWFCALDLDKINQAECCLIDAYQPPWNIQRR